MRRTRIVSAAMFASLLLAGSARAEGDPIMPLTEVHKGMRCTGYSVVSGVGIDSFTVDVIDVLEDSAGTGARILVEVSGPAVDDTGIGPGFSGSPVYCSAGGEPPRVAGAISESIGEYGGRVVLATPIEDIIGESPDPPADAPAAGPTGPTGPSATSARSATSDHSAARHRTASTNHSAVGGGDPSGAAAAALSRRLPAPYTGRRVRPIATPISVSGLSPALGRQLQAAGRRRGRLFLAAPSSPIGRYEPQVLRPGSAFGVGYSSGDVSVGAIGTIAYVDGRHVWGFGHSFEGVGRRSLLLQDAYVYDVINNPNQLGELGGTYKLAAAGHDLGTVSNDALEAVVGDLGGLPATIPVRFDLRDLDTKATRLLTVRVADEADLGQPAGASPLAFVAPLGVTQGATTLLRGNPTRMTGAMCLRIVLRERAKPIRFCNRYVGAGTGGDDGGNPVAVAAAGDVLDALTLIDGFKFRDLHVTEVSARIELKRGAAQAFIRRVIAPSHPVRRGQRITLRVVIQRVRGPQTTVPVSFRVPSGVAPGRRTLTLTGTDADTGEGSELFDQLSGALTLDLGAEEEPTGGDPGPRTVAELAQAIKRLRRYDGVRASFSGGGPRNAKAFRETDLRISGRARVTLRIARRGHGWRRAA